MSAVQKSLLAAVGAIGLIGMASGASATIVTADVNLGNAAAATGSLFTGVSNIPNVSLLTLGNGDSVVIQNVGAGGNPNGQNFTETGVVQITSMTSNGVGVSLTPGPLNPTFGGLGSATGLFFQFNLTGSVDGSGGLHFNPGGIAGLYLTDSTTVDVLNPVAPGSTKQLLATFDLLNSGGTGLISAGGIPSGTIQLNFKEDPASPFKSLFTVGGNPLDAVSFELANVQPALSSQPGVPNPNPNPGPGPNQETIYVTDQGQIQLTVPEPGTLMILGTGLLGLAGLVRRHRNLAA